MFLPAEESPAESRQTLQISPTGTLEGQVCIFPEVGEVTYLSGLNGFCSLEVAFLQVGHMICPQPAFVVTAHDVASV